MPLLRLNWECLELVQVLYMTTCEYVKSYLKIIRDKVTVKELQVSVIVSRPEYKATFFILYVADSLNLVLKLLLFCLYLSEIAAFIVQHCFLLIFPRGTCFQRIIMACGNPYPRPHLTDILPDHDRGLAP